MFIMDLHFTLLTFFFVIKCISILFQTDTTQLEWCTRKNHIQIRRITLLSESYLILKGFTNRLKKDHVSAYAAQAAFFLFMSIIPFLSLLLTLIKFLPITQTMLYSSVYQIIPEPFEPLAKNILDELFTYNTNAYFSISVLLLIWTAAKGVMAVLNGLKSVYQIEERRNYLITRMISAIYTLAFVLIILVMMLILVFGNRIYQAIQQDYPKTAGILAVFVKQKLILSLLVLILFFIFIYKIVRFSAKTAFIIPGAIFSSVSWSLLSYAYSVYINHFGRYSYTYGSLTTIVLFMLWVYFCFYLMLMGAEINSYFKVYFEKSFIYIKYNRLFGSKKDS